MDGGNFLLTRRPYTTDKKRLSAPDVPLEELDLRANDYVNLSREDIKKNSFVCQNCLVGLDCLLCDRIPAKIFQGILLGV